MANELTEHQQKWIVLDRRTGVKGQGVALLGYFCVGSHLNGGQETL